MIFKQNYLQLIREKSVYYLNGKRFTYCISCSGRNTYTIMDSNRYLYAENFKIDDNKKAKDIDLDIGIEGYNILYELLQKNGTISKLMVSVVQQNINSVYNEDIEDRNENLYIEINVTYRICDIFFPLTRSKQILYSKQNSILKECIIVSEEIVMQYKKIFRIPFIEIKSGNYDLILGAGAGGVLIHEGIGHNLEADIYYKKNSLLNGRIGRKEFDSTINIIDSCKTNNFINYKYSADGTKAKNISLIKNGVIQELMSDKYTSLYFHITDTGNGRAATFENSIIPRMRNTYMESGNTDPKDIVKSMKYGIFAMELGGGSVDVTTGNFVLHIALGGIVKNGELIGLLSPCIVKGNVLKTLNCINGIGNDLKFKYTKCIKDGQELNVSFGCSTIKLVNQQIYC